jgi:hypothetical protein
LKPIGVNRQQSSFCLGYSGGAARPVVHQGDLAQASAWTDGINAFAAHENIHLPIQQDIHHSARLIAFGENRRPGGNSLRVIRMFKHVYGHRGSLLQISLGGHAVYTRHFNG